MIWSATEGTIPAPETTHAIAAAIQEAEKAKEEGREKVILFNYSGHGLMDLSAYSNYLAGNLKDSTLPDEALEESLGALKNLPKPKVRKK